MNHWQLYKNLWNEPPITLVFGVELLSRRHHFPPLTQQQHKIGLHFLQETICATRSRRIDSRNTLSSITISSRFVFFSLHPAKFSTFVSTSFITSIIIRFTHLQLPTILECPSTDSGFASASDIRSIFSFQQHHNGYPPPRRVTLNHLYPSCNSNMFDYPSICFYNGTFSLLDLIPCHIIHIDGYILARVSTVWYPGFIHHRPHILYLHYEHLQNCNVPLLQGCKEQFYDHWL